MGQPRFLVENFFDLDLFSSHSVSAEEETAEHEAWRVGTVRRHPRNFWTPTTANSSTYIGVTLDRTRLADAIFIDRNNNLAGATIRLRASNDNWTTYTEVFSLTFPSQVFWGGRLSQSPGVLTEEGAWGLQFNAHAARYWRLYIDAMGSGLKPQIGGLYLGLSWQPTRHPQLPSDDEPRRLAFEEKVSPALWTASNRKASRRESGSHPLVIPLASLLEESQVRYHFGALFWAGRYGWLVFDDEQAERAVLCYAPPGIYGAPNVDPYLHRVLTVHWAEYNPAPR